MTASGALASTAANHPTTEPQRPKRIETLFGKFAEIYGHKWASSYGEIGNGSDATWAKGLAGLSGEQLAQGLSACLLRNDPWPPSLPEFRAMCCGIPSLEAVQAELMRPGAEQSGFLVLVWAYVDAYRLARADQAKADRMVAAAYGIAVERVMRGEPIPEPVLRLTAEKTPKPTPMTPEQFAARIEAVKAELPKVPMKAAGVMTPDPRCSGCGGSGSYSGIACACTDLSRAPAFSDREAAAVDALCNARPGDIRAPFPSSDVETAGYDAPGADS